MLNNFTLFGVKVVLSLLVSFFLNQLYKSLFPEFRGTLEDQTVGWCTYYAQKDRLFLVFTLNAISNEEMLNNLAIFLPFLDFGIKQCESSNCCHVSSPPGAPSPDKALVAEVFKTAQKNPLAQHQSFFFYSRPQTLLYPCCQYYILWDVTLNRNSGVMTQHQEALLGHQHTK